MSEIQTELYEYLKEKNLNELFVSIVDAILIYKPENPIGFMVNYLLERFSEETKDVCDKLKQQENPPILFVNKKCSNE